MSDPSSHTIYFSIHFASLYVILALLITRVLNTRILKICMNFNEVIGGNKIKKMPKYEREKSTTYVTITLLRDPHVLYNDNKLTLCVCVYVCVCMCVCMCAHVRVCKLV